MTWSLRETSLTGAMTGWLQIERRLQWIGGNWFIGIGLENEKSAGDIPQHFVFAILTWRIAKRSLKLIAVSVNEQCGLEIGPIAGLFYY